MAETRTTWAVLLAQFADNTAGAISAEDLRDFVASARPFVTTTAPTTAHDETLGFDVGHGWLDVTGPTLYECVDAATGAAVWVQVYPASSSTAWGGITGTLTDQTDLVSALGLKADSSSLGTAAAADVGDFATAAQGAKADAALPKLATVNSYAGNRTLDASDSGAYVRITAAGTVTLPDGLSDGFQCVIVNATDSATVALSAATTLTIPSGYDAEVVNRRAVTVIHVGSNVWEAHGALVETP